MTKIGFADRVVVITGAASGLGKEYAYFFGNLKAKLILNDLERSAEPMNKIVSDLRGKGVEVYTKLCSVTEGDQIVYEAINKFGRIDVLINNAGYCEIGMFEDNPDDLWYRTIDINLHGTYKPLKAAWEIMLKQDYGRIINVASPFGLYGEQTAANYSAAKGAVISLTYALAKEVKGANVHINAIAPIAYTRMTEDHLKGSLKDYLHPKYVAPLVAYLAHESCAENGSIYEVGGGWIAKVRWQNSSINLALDHTADDVAREIQKTHSFTENVDYHRGSENSIRKMLKNARTMSKL